MGRPFPGARCCRANVVRPPTRLELSHYGAPGIRLLPLCGCPGGQFSAHVRVVGSDRPGRACPTGGDSTPGRRWSMPEGRKVAAILKGDLVADGSVAYEHGWVAYRDFGGQGPAVMLVHGLGGNLAHWGRVAPILHE